MIWVRIVLPYAVFGIKVNLATLKVVDAAPIGHWMVGENIRLVEHWVKRKGGYLHDLQIRERALGSRP
jgi:hypothetical protein